MSPLYTSLFAALLCVYANRAFGFSGANKNNPTVPLPAPRQVPTPEENGTCVCGQRNLQRRVKDTEMSEYELHRIIGGTEAELNEFPWRCAIFYEDRNKAVKYYCGCSLISPQWVMTAAHCTEPLKRNRLLVNLGDHDLSTLKETQNQVIYVDSVKQHEKYNKKTMDNDISLLRLQTPANITKTVSPVCLPFGLEEKLPSKFKVTASGWGVTSHGARKRPTTLRKVDLDVISPAECRRHLGRGAITDNMICALTPQKDACQGDSGSSIDHLDSKSGRTYALGVVSWGRGCGRRNSPGVYTSVTRMLPWIRNNAGNEFCGT